MNPRPSDYKSDALPTELPRRALFAACSAKLFHRESHASLSPLRGVALSAAEPDTNTPKVSLHRNSRRGRLSKYIKITSSALMGFTGMRSGGGRGRIRTSVARKERQIYSLLVLATHPPVRTGRSQLRRPLCSQRKVETQFRQLCDTETRHRK